MIRKGIYNIDQLFENHWHDIFGRERNISILLYDEINRLNDFKDHKIQERILYRFKIKNVYKRTYVNRFDKFDDWLSDKIHTHLGASAKPRVHELAASDGRASVNLYNVLTSKYNDNFNLTLSDIIPYVNCLKFPGKKYYAVTDDQDNILEITKPPYVWNMGRPESRIYFINNLMKRVCRRKISKLIAGGNITERTKIWLISKDMHDIISKAKNIRIRRYDVLSPSEESYDVIRAMNILRPSYFNPEQLRIILQHIYDALNDKGLLIVGSNKGKIKDVDAVVFVKTADGFEKYLSYNDSISYEDEISGFRKHPVTAQLSAT